MSKIKNEKDKRTCVKKSNATLFSSFIVKFFYIFLGIVVLIGSVFFLPVSDYKIGFCNINELKEYAKTIREDFEVENENLLFPSFENYYNSKFSRSLLRKWKKKLLYFFYTFGIVNYPVFSSSFFKNLLNDVLVCRQQEKWKGNFVQKIEVTPKTKIVVFGVVQGAYHSLVRYLEQLVKLNIIDENLKLTSPDYYIAFLGNVVNRSPYTLEIFSIVLRLLQENPKQIVYLRGTNEYFDYWKEHSLRKELEIRCQYLLPKERANDRNAIPLKDEVNSFFDTLPQVFYCTMPHISTKDVMHYFKMHAYIDSTEILKMIDDSKCSLFIAKSNEKPLETFYYSEKTVNVERDGSKGIFLRAIVTDILKRYNFEKTDGLSLIPPTEGVITWTIFSSPASVYKKFLNHIFDSFCILECDTSYKTIIVYHCYREIYILDKQPFNWIKYDLLIGK
jgi:hypothetical protein